MPSPGLGTRRMESDKEAPMPVNTMAAARIASCSRNSPALSDPAGRSGSMAEKMFINLVNTILRGI